MHEKTFIYGHFLKNILLKICFEKTRVRLQGPCTRLQKSVHVAALTWIYGGGIGRKMFLLGNKGSKREIFIHAGDRARNRTFLSFQCPHTGKLVSNYKSNKRKLPQAAAVLPLTCWRKRYASTCCGPVCIIYSRHYRGSERVYNETYNFKGPITLLKTTVKHPLRIDRA